MARSQGRLSTISNLAIKTPSLIALIALYYLYHIPAIYRANSITYSCINVLKDFSQPSEDRSEFFSLYSGLPRAISRAYLRPTSSRKSFNTPSIRPNTLPRHTTTTVVYLSKPFTFGSCQPLAQPPHHSPPAARSYPWPPCPEGKPSGDDAAQERAILPPKIHRSLTRLLQPWLNHMPAPPHCGLPRQRQAQAALPLTRL